MPDQSFTQSLFDVSGKRVLVTGATSGIGRMIARALASAGADVWVAARSAADVAAIREELGCEGVAADVTSDEGLAAIGAALAGRPLSVLVNNAGMNVQNPLVGGTREDFADVLDLNLTAPYRVIQQVLPNLEAGAAPGDPARIINISSVAILAPGPSENFAYSASKAGLAWLTRHMGRVLAPRNITSNAIAPGLFPSRLSEKFLNVGEGDEPPEFLRSPIGQRMGTVEDIAGAVIYLSSRAGAWVTGTVMPVTGGVSTVT